MNNPVQLFLKIIHTVSKGRIRLKPNSTIGELFHDLAVFGPLEYELCLYSLEATVKRKIADSFYWRGVEKDFQTTIEDFIARYLRATVSKDPVFVTRQFMKFAKSAQWEGDEKTEHGKN